MAFAQPGIFAVGTRSHLHVEFDVDDPQAAAAAVHRVRDAATGVVGVNLVVGFGPRMWSALAPEQMPTGFTDFEPIVGAGGYTIPGGQHDLWLWAHGTGADGVFDVARHAALELEASGRVATEQASFVYRASQDLTGFEDGTENPPLGEAMGVATIPEGDPCAGGSVVLLQRWVHDLAGMKALSLPDREQVVGRTLDGSEEIAEVDRSARSHISRVVIEDEAGEELEVFRRSTAFGGVAEHGLMFVAFSADHARLAEMLGRMAGVDDGVRDNLTEFSVPTASAWYVAPPVDLLDHA